MTARSSRRLVILTVSLVVLTRAVESGLPSTHGVGVKSTRRGADVGWSGVALIKGNESASKSESLLEIAPERLKHAPHLSALLDNAVYAAYAAQLSRLMTLPAKERRYVMAVPLSGWGNKIRVIATGMQLALALDRILVVDRALMRPFYGSIFREPFSPWFSTDVPDGGISALLPHASARIVLKAPHKRNDAAKCWFATHDLRGCTRVQRASVLDSVNVRHDCGPPVLILEGYFNGDALVHADAALRRNLEATLNGLVPPGPGMIPSDIRSHLDALVMTAILPSPARALRANLRAAQAELNWDATKLHVGVHIRSFVDYARRRVSAQRIAPAFWQCISKHVIAAQSALGIGANETLIFVASDQVTARPRARKELSHLGRVSWVRTPVGNFLHSEKLRDARALAAVLTDWWLLSQSDLVIGTELSTFAPAAAVRGSHPLALANLRHGRCGRLARVHLGTVN